MSGPARSDDVSQAIRSDEAPDGRAATDERIRVAAYVVAHDDQGRVLLCHIAPWVGIGDRWTLPGGGLEFGESPSDGAVRELAEETGLVGEVTGLIDVSDGLFREPGGAGALHAIRIVYAARVVDGRLRDEPDGSTDRCRWMTPEDVAGVRLVEVARRALAVAHLAGASAAGTGAEDAAGAAGTDPGVTEPSADRLTV